MNPEDKFVLTVLLALIASITAMILSFVGCSREGSRHKHDEKMACIAQHGEWDFDACTRISVKR